MTPAAVAFGICVAAAALEALLAGGNARARLAELRQPRWAAPGWAWAVIGVAYYAICGFALWRILQSPAPGRNLALGALVAVMALNCAWNYIFFRRRDLRLAFLYYVAYLPLVGFALWSAARVDAPAAWALSAYAAYLPYAIALGYRWWRPA
ncbi:MAG TPA: TspO/MBR family protein [Terriglobales bacterium]|nr:TspO/MBR family protein [Terriglobales bacterium]